MSPLSHRTRRTLWAVIAAMAVVAAVLVFTTPPDVKLGAMLRLVLFHGASTWVNLGTFTLAGALGVGALLGMKRLVPYGEAFRWISLPLWGVNTVLGLLSMQLIWGGILWDEPRLSMTFYVLAASVIVVAVQLIFGLPKLSALFDALLAAGLWTAVLVLPNLFHPDSPVFNSENVRIVGSFLGQVAAVGVIAGCAAVLIARRRQDDDGAGAGVREPAPEPAPVGAVEADGPSR
ncbi:MAG: hypothetical protein QMC79_04910 [Anaerosomatales bacterium]|nr:hypothetical protein [Anaerosomatales bacterium]